MVSSQLRRAFKFFLTHAGYCTPPGRAACALSLARAEIQAEEEGFTVEWVPDDMPWEGDCQAPSDVLGCIVTSPDGESSSLWGIGDPDNAYRRVVEAELSSDVLRGMFADLAEHIRQL